MDSRDDYSLKIQGIIEETFLIHWILEGEERQLERYKKTIFRRKEVYYIN